MTATTAASQQSHAARSLAADAGHDRTHPGQAPRFLLKVQPSDFAVSECLAFNLSQEGDAPFHYLGLAKSGYTTFEAIDAVVDAFGLARDQVSYCGLKDEDAITRQTISVAGRLTDEQVRTFNSRHDGGAQYMVLTSLGFADKSLQIGALDGNSFRIVVRDLDPVIVDGIKSLSGRCHLQYVNYYDTQRFGVPDAPKTTHLIGQALLENDHRRAFELLKASGSAEGNKASGHTGSADAYFDRIDRRLLAFYYCSYASHLWNARLRAVLTDVSESPLEAVDKEGIPFLFARQDDILRLQHRHPSIPYAKYRAKDGQIQAFESERTSVLNLQVRIETTGEDEMRPGRGKAELCFFLNSGAYATNAVAHFIRSVQWQMPDSLTAPARPRAM
ncbi:MAG: tRNA pseudouridine(13) synthase TruD [Roseibium sp.]|nr:tRNA pseudouridine(13) synthase TruD [Roseibium sp.]